MPRDTVEEFHLLLPMKAKAPSPAASDDVLSALIDGRKLIEDSRCWLQIAARAKLPDRDCYCSHGALHEATRAQYDAIGHNAWDDKFYAALCAGVPADYRGSPSAINYNDARGRTHAEVMSMWDRAISSRLAEIEG